MDHIIININTFKISYARQPRVVWAEDARRSKETVDRILFRQVEEYRQSILAQILTPEAKDRRIDFI